MPENANLTLTQCFGLVESGVPNEELAGVNGRIEKSTGEAISVAGQDWACYLSWSPIYVGVTRFQRSGRFLGWLPERCLF